MCCLTPSLCPSQRLMLPWGKSKIPPYGRNLCCGCVTIEYELGEYCTTRGPLWRMAVLSWGKWKALDRSPWSRLSSKVLDCIERLQDYFWVFVLLWCWISYGLRTKVAFLSFKTTLYKSAGEWEKDYVVNWVRSLLVEYNIYVIQGFK